MSFVTKSANYSETDLLKTKFLKDVCKNVVSTIEKYPIEKTNFYKDRTDTGEADDEIYIPNNNKKYFLFLIKKNLLSNCDNDWSVLYFFPDEKTIEFYNNDKFNKNNISDFYIETNFNIPHISHCLFEGYLYKRNENHSHYLITDILHMEKHNKNTNFSVLSLDYISRFSLINEIFINNNDLSVKNINNHIDIGIHQIFSKSKKNMISIFKNNFIYKDEICCLETIHKKIFKKISYIEPNNKIEEKWIEKSNRFVDVYNVYDINTMNNQGILYIRGIKESKNMIKLFDGQEKIKIKCIWNNIFNKWQPLLS